MSAPIPSSVRKVLMAGAASLASVFLFLPAAGASSPPVPAGLVYVNVNNPVSNAVAVFAAHGDGSLTYLASYPTQGEGGQAAGAAADYLASQGSVTFDSAGDLVLAVNAGSDTLSVFGLFGDTLSLRQVLPTNGEFPTSVAASGDLVYVLNAGGTGSVSGFSLSGGQLQPIANSTVSLGLSNANPPNYLLSPGQVVFSPDGSELFVTTKASTSDILAYHVDSDGRLWAAPVVTPAAAPVPFAVAFAWPNKLIVAEALDSVLSTYSADSDGQLTAESSLPDGETALCWVVSAGEYVYVANAGSGNISGYRLGPNGQLSLISTTGVVGTTSAGAIDLTVVPGTDLLYIESGVPSGTPSVDGFIINPDGALTSVGSVAVRDGAYMEGIASS